jgi:hypothetical protein
MMHLGYVRLRRPRRSPKPDRRRALEWLAASPDGCTEALMHYRGRAGEDYRGGAGVLGAWGSGGGGGLGRQDTMRPENARGPRGRALDRAIRLPFEDIEHATREGKEDSGARLIPSP